MMAIFVIIKVLNALKGILRKVLEDYIQSLNIMH